MIISTWFKWVVLTSAMILVSIIEAFVGILEKFIIFYIFYPLIYAIQVSASMLPASPQTYSITSASYWILNLAWLLISIPSTLLSAGKLYETIISKLYGTEDIMDEIPSDVDNLTVYVIVIVSIINLIEFFVKI